MGDGDTRGTAGNSALQPAKAATSRSIIKSACDETHPATAQTILRHWREAVPDDRLAHLVKDATRALVRALQMRLAEHAVSFGHWTFLRILWEGDGLTQRELSEQAGVMEPTTFSALKAMERLGYVRRRRRDGDRKKVYVLLTPKGQRLRDRLVPLAEEREPYRGSRRTTRGHLDHTRRAAGDHRKYGQDEQAADMQMPSTRELGRLKAGGRKRRRRRRTSIGNQHTST